MVRRQWISLGLLVGGWAAAGLMVLLPTGTTWGVYHEPGPNKPPLRLSASLAYEQTFAPEFSHIGGLLLFIKPPIQDEGRLLIDLQQGDDHQVATVQLAQIPVTGEVFVPLRAFRVSKHELVSARVSIVETSQVVELLYQIDATKYPEGELFRVATMNGTRKSKAGDLAFRVDYQSSVLERMRMPVTLALIGTVLSVGGWYGLRRLAPEMGALFHLRWQRRDTWFVIALSVLVGGFFLYHFDPTHLSQPTAQGDEAKNLLYLNSTIVALKAGVLPQWHHLTCGGQPLMGNPEANTFGAGPFLGLLVGAAAGIKLLVVLEAVALAVGLYVMSRYVGLLPIPALLPALVVPLSGYVVNRVLIGHTMFTGGLSFTPWILLTYLLSLRSRYWIVVTAALMVGALYRGDTHSLFYTLMLMAVWGIVLAVERRSGRPLVLGLLAGIFFVLFGMGKIMPILENTAHFNGDALAPMVVLLNQTRLWDDIFLDRSIHTKYLSAELTGAEWEDWENIGLYTGLVPIVLLVIGLWVAPRRLGWLLGSGLLVFLVLGEGSLYHLYLRQLPYLGSLLRLPSRTLIMAVIVGTMAGAFALQRIERLRFGRLLAVGILVWSIVDVGQYAHQTLRRMEFSAPESVSVDEIPLILEPHPYKPGLHLLTVAQRNSVAPGSCQDFNVAPTFVITPGTPLITTAEGKSVAAQLRPSSIQISPPNSRKIIVRIMDASILKVANGYTLPATAIGLPIVVREPDEPVTLTYTSPSLSAGLTLSLASAASLLLLWSTRKLTERRQ